MKTKKRKDHSNYSRYKRLMTAWRADEWAHLIVQAREYLKDYPNDRVAWELYGIGLFEVGRYEDARKVLSRAINLTPVGKRRRPYCEMGNLYKEKGQYQAAARWYKKGIDEDPDNAGSYIFLGAALMRRSTEEAMKCHRRATECSKGDIDEAYLNLGLALRVMERFDEALVCFRKALELDPKYALAKKGIRDLEKALKYLEKNDPDA